MPLFISSQIARQSPEPVANESPIDARTGGLDAVITLQVPGYSLWTKTADPPELEDFLDGLVG